MDLTLDEKRTLLRIARRAIAQSVGVSETKEELTLTTTLKQKSGAFVTLEKNGRLRGCVGFVEAFEPLHKTVAEAAISAAQHDHRFETVKREELPELELEVSVLSPFEKVPDPSLIEPGKHGLMIRSGFRQGLLLPQVATEYGWDRETFLEQTCIKAGLPKSAWRSQECTIEWFTATVFNERELNKA